MFMMKRVVMTAALAGALALVFVPGVQAQTGVVAQSGGGQGLFSAWADRIFVNLNGVAQSLPAPLEIKGGSTFSIYDETATTSSSQTVTFKKKPFDVSGGVRVFNNIGLGVGYTSTSTVDSGILSASVPHPLVYNSPRTAGGTLSGLDHFESALHLMVVYAVKLPKRFEVMVSAGPSFYKVSQDTIGAVSVQSGEVSPYTKITLTSPSVITTEAKKVGFNAGIDLAWFSNFSVSVLSNVGVGVFVKYAGTTIDVTPEGGTAIPMKVGGVQYGGGLRIRFKIGP
jgi:hypothetical protein